VAGLPPNSTVRVRKVESMSVPGSIHEYLRMFGSEVGERIVRSYPALHNAQDPISPRLAKLLRKPFPAQAVAAMAIAKKWEKERSAAVIAECGTGKTLISLAALDVHSDGQPFTAIVMAPGHITLKWCKEALETIPRLRVFLIDGLRDRVRDSTPCGVNEVRLRRGQIVREGLHTSLTDLRLRKNHKSARARWRHEICPGPALFVVGRDKGKLSHFWRHAYQIARCGQYLGSVVNPDTGVRIELGERWLLAADFRKARISEIIGGVRESQDGADSKARRPIYSPLWQADGKRIRRVAPLDFIGRYMDHWFDYAICDEAHQLANDTAQGNGLRTLAACADRTLILTGTLLGGYASDVYNLLFRLEPGKMVARGYEWGESGLRSFSEAYGVLEKVTTIEPADNSCSKARVTHQIKRRPGASPLLFGDFLMSLAAFVSLEDISTELPPYTEEVIGVPMDAPLQAAYKALEEEITNAIRQHRSNHSVISAGLNALLLYPDHAWDIGDLYGYEYDPETHRREPFLIARPEDLDQDFVYAKERRLLEIVKAELKSGRRCCHVYAVYTQKRDVTRRLANILEREGIRVAVLRSDVPPEKREAWFAQRLREGIQVTISHPKIIETGIDLLAHSSLLFFETGYSIHTLRQASRRSWRIGQGQAVRVFYLHYEDTMQSNCLRLMGKKLLVSLAMEGKFCRDGLQGLEQDDDMLTAMARELVTERGIGESAAAVWRQIQAEHNTVAAPPSITPELTPVKAEMPLTAPMLTPDPTVPVILNALKFGSRPPSARPARRSGGSPDGAQFPLF
jgi:superfamily II DNA or RNA helicase